MTKYIPPSFRRNLVYQQKSYIHQQKTFMDNLMNGFNLGLGASIGNKIIDNIFSNKDDSKCKELLEHLEKCKENYSYTHSTDNFCKDIIENYNKFCS